MNMRPDPTFYASPKLAMQSPTEDFAYTVASQSRILPARCARVIDVSRARRRSRRSVHTLLSLQGRRVSSFRLERPARRRCRRDRSCVPRAPLPDNSGSALVADLRDRQKAHPTQATIHKIIEPEEVFRKTGYSGRIRFIAVPKAFTVSTLLARAARTARRPPGVFIMDCQTFEVLGRVGDRTAGSRQATTFLVDLPRDYMVSSEWALPPQFENGIVPEDLLSNKYGHRVIFGIEGASQRCRRSISAQPPDGAGDPAGARSDARIRIPASWSTPRTSRASIWTWWREGGKFHIGENGNDSAGTRPTRIGFRLSCKASEPCPRW